MATGHSRGQVQAFTRFLDRLERPWKAPLNAVKDTWTENAFIPLVDLDMSCVFV